MNIVNEYKIKDGITASDIKAELKEKRMPVREGGTYIHKDAEFLTFFTLAKDITANIAFPKDLSVWDSFDHILVMDEMGGQPYYPFYHADDEESRRFPFVLNVIGNYNKMMDRFDFLQRLDGEELERMKKRHEVV